MAAEQNSQICAALFYKSDVLRNDILIHKELNKNIFFLQDILMPRIYVKCKKCLNFKYIKGKKLMKVMILPNNSILEYVRFFYYLPLDIYCEIKNSNNQNYSIRINFGTLLEEGIISMGLSQKVKGVFNHKGWFQWTFNFMLRKII